MLRTGSALRRDEVIEAGENYSKRSFMICTFHHILLGRSRQGDKMGRECILNGGDEKRTQNSV
jgi:hypothetical protein